MQHKCKLTVLRKELYKDLQQEYLADPQSGVCPLYQVGQEFVFERYGQADDFWTMGRGTQCSEAWDAISRYIYTALQGGSIMRNWTNDERMMIACCSDGTRPVIFKIERIDYKVVYLDSVPGAAGQVRMATELMAIDGVSEVRYREDTGFLEVMMDYDVPDEAIRAALDSAGAPAVTKID